MILAAKVAPELPNFVSLLYRYFPSSPFASFAYYWQDLIFSILCGISLSIFFVISLRKKSLVPTGLQNFLEFIYENLLFFCKSILGHEGTKYAPFLGTLFLYILSMNLFGLIPLLKSPSSNFNVTIALSITVFLFVQYLNIRQMGIKGFLYHLAGSPKTTIGWLLVPLLFPIELLTQISRPITLALRLFGNIFGEKILISFFAMVGITLVYFLPVHTPFMLLGVMTGIMQAVVFTLLSAIYISLSFPHEEEVENKN